MRRGGHYIRYKIAERRNRRQRSNSNDDQDGMSCTTEAASYTCSQLMRQTSNGEFCLVDNESSRRTQSLYEDGSRMNSDGGEVGSREDQGAMGEDGEDLADAHFRQEQQQQQQHESEDSASDGDLEKLDISDDDEPRPKPTGANADSLGLDGLQKGREKKLWEVTNTEVFEQQLMILQEQLTSALIENQSLQRDTDELHHSKTELTRLRRENVILSRRLEVDSRETTDFDTSFGSRISSTPPMLESAASGSGLRARGEPGRSSYGGSILSVTEDEGFESVSMSPDARIARQREQQRAQKKSYFRFFIEWVYDFVADFTEEQSSNIEPEPEDPLAVKKLKINLKRLSRTSKPWREFGNYLRSILEWRNTSESLVVFLIYMYCMWHGWMLSMLIFLGILMLTLTYLRTSGLAEQFGFQARPSVVESEENELGFGDKLQLVKQVAQTGQNQSKMVSDSLEKAQNLFLWHQPVATMKIYRNLCVFFVASIFLPNGYIFTIIGIFAGLKLFIIDNIYRKYPKVKEKYDGLARLWKSLPTDAQLLQRQALTEEQLGVENSASLGLAGGDGHVTSHLSESAVAFCTRFQLSPDELPLPSWQTGKRCSIMDKDKPLSLTRTGRLYLTHSRLCFERNFRQLRDPDRFSLALKNVLKVKKAKPFAVLPGSGMSVEVILKTGDKYLFSAILNRDQAFQSILDQGMILGLPWGTVIGGRVEGEGKGDKQAKSLADASVEMVES